MRFSDVTFLEVEEVEEQHAIELAISGGSAGIRDRGLLQSAVMRPQASFGGAPLYPTLATMAATYLVGIAQNHAFVDGNKRAALQVCVAFLRLNGFDVTLTTNPWHAHVLDVASGALDVQQVTALLVRELGGDVDIGMD